MSDALSNLKALTRPHVDSFDWFIEHGLDESVLQLPPHEFEVCEGAHVLRMWWEQVRVTNPSKGDDSLHSALRPRECRERRTTYSAPFLGRLRCQLDGARTWTVDRSLGELPIMVRSCRCALAGKAPEELVRLREEANELGGYFIINGNEKVVRLLQVPRRNFAAAVTRSSYKNRGPQFSDKGVSMRCARPDQTTATVTLHYLTTGDARLRFAIRKQEFLVPVVIVLRALSAVSDRELYERALAGADDNTFLSARLEVLLATPRRWGLRSHRECLEFLGARFRATLRQRGSLSDADVGRALLHRHVLVHADDHATKFECLMHMLRKLYCFVQGGCGEDNADALSNQELLLPGHLLSAFVKEKLDEAIEGVAALVARDARVQPEATQRELSGDRAQPYITKLVDRAVGGLGAKVATLLSTGNVVSSTGLDLMQAAGFAVVAERLNMWRYLAHFRAVHRGQFFTTMKTTAVRKLLPESWGFLCPVHTPDGEPCGLLNHLAAAALVIASPPRSDASEALASKVIALGVLPTGVDSADGALVPPRAHLPVLVDGVVVGSASALTCARVGAALRALKVAEPPTIEPTLEVGLVLPDTGSSIYPGLYLFTGAARLVRPVLQCASGRVELIGSFEQVHLDIASRAGDPPTPGAPPYTHSELDPTNMLSLLASLTPFSDYNQSPRNMYQCQMGKQTMATPAHSLPHRTDNKLYRLLTPQAPLVRTRRYVQYGLDEYPQGTNAVVAVISYTGYDMEDAMILNKSSFERGFGHGVVYKTVWIDLDDEGRARAKKGGGKLHFGTPRRAGWGGARSSHDECGLLDADGFPPVGLCVGEGDALWCAVDELSDESVVGHHKESEPAYIERVRRIAVGSADQPRRAAITLRIRRNPVIGDKFSSRHGQKGVLSILWPATDMPFTDAGLSPDVIINPHAFPSRMTIGMLIESMAGKAGALDGEHHDATPFRFDESNGGQRAIDCFGEKLRASGYAYLGSEPMYSGISGTPMHADIFVGLVYYQRLRHMVSDKSQVRATGAVHQLTRQPIGGRKRHGGIRLGEMERDALLAQGTAFLLHDRLTECSDRHVAYVCTNRECGSLITPLHQQLPSTQRRGDGAPSVSCVACAKANRADRCEKVALPYVFIYLAVELAAMGICLRLQMRDCPFLG